VDFSVGNSFFRSPWVIAPSTTTARDGLGPLFNTNACQNCHIGRPRPPAGTGDSNAVSMLVRLSIPISRPTPTSSNAWAWCRSRSMAASSGHGRARRGARGQGAGRATPSAVRFKDGTEVELRKPAADHPARLRPDAPDTRFSARIAPPMIGLGLLEAIPKTHPGQRRPA
jgi:CxxC motif-containing protein (DUF1111 family)